MPSGHRWSLRRWFQRVWLLAITIAIAVVVLVPWMALVALAHPLGNFTVNTASGFVIRPEVLTLGYTVDLAEIPTTQSLAEIDVNVDGEASQEELQSWADAKAPLMAANFTLRLDGLDVTPTVVGATAVLEPGQAEGTFVIRFASTFEVRVGETGEVTYRDGNFQGGAGWSEVSATGADGAVVVSSDVPETSPSGDLRNYPPDAATAPLDVTEARFSFAPGASGPLPSPAVAGDASRLGAEQGGFAGLLGRDGVALTALLLAVGFGAIHALAPGHGKTIMAGYMVGGGARTSQAVAAGIAIALMHVTSVLVLGFAIAWAEESFAPEEVYPWLGLVAGLVVLGLGTGLLVTRARAGRVLVASEEHHDHPPAHLHEEEHAHVHAPLPKGTNLLSRKGIAALAVSGGLLPSPTAIVVLLGAVAVDRIGYGLMLIACFSVGLAAALVGIGVFAVKARDVVVVRMGSRLGRLAPIFGAAVMAAVGMFLVARALTQL